jgi:hypothetical protein
MTSHDGGAFTAIDMTLYQQLAGSVEERQMWQELLNHAYPYLTSFRADLIHDWATLRCIWEENFTFLYSVRDSGTVMTQDAAYFRQANKTLGAIRAWVVRVVDFGRRVEFEPWEG